MCERVGLLLRAFVCLCVCWKLIQTRAQTHVRLHKCKHALEAKKKKRKRNPGGYCSSELFFRGEKINGTQQPSARELVRLADNVEVNVPINVLSSSIFRLRSADKQTSKQEESQQADRPEIASKTS